MSSANAPGWAEEDQATTGDSSLPNMSNSTLPGRTTPTVADQTQFRSSDRSDLDQEQVLRNPALLAIRIGTQKNLNPQQMQELQALTMSLAKFAQGPDLFLAIFNVASQLQVTQLVYQLQSSVNELSSDLKDIKESLADTPKLSTEQKSQIGRACNAVMFNVNRRSFNNNNITKDAYDKLKAERKLNGFNGHFKDPQEDFRVAICYEPLRSQSTVPPGNHR
ncbi:hypothetical protein K435DRAFT_865773 [Dendrothele bispora CBS 962.96]|uniref:Uncharacterized protein n=1 Tax=Dendrothele bispora (strain CBS 962.96) TaxID=1314807 RepID=A0A4S8LJC0_DENBC|nr:hypothetical protein K435DRAFT_865773 [Dendrothele bispora CBS 962.96]